jgi:predicted dehydrogenase
VSSDLQIGLVGAPRASSFLGALRALEGVRVAALCDTNPAVLEEIATRHMIERRYTECEQMLAADLDAVVIATPMPFHAPQAILALEAGKHVLSEVPAATDLEQCWGLAQAVRSSGRCYMMAENYCYMKPNVLVRELCRRGLLGELYFGEGEYIHELKGLNERTPWRRRWQTGRNGNTYPTHSLGPLLQWFEDRVVSVSCLGSGHHHRDPRGALYENEDTTLMTCRLSRGGLLNLRLDMLSNRPHNMCYYSLQGTLGCYEAPRGFGDGPKIWLADRSESPNQWRSLWDLEDEFMPALWRDPPPEAVQAGHGGGDFFEVAEFVEAIRNDAPPPIDVYSALDMTVPGLVSQESIARDGVPLPVPDFRAISRFPDDLPEELQRSSILSLSDWPGAPTVE